MKLDIYICYTILMKGYIIMGTAIGMWICVILAFVSFFVGVMNDHGFIGSIVGLIFVFFRNENI